MQLVERALGTDDLPDELDALIIAKTGGNPFFIEEVIKTLTETGVLEVGKSGYQLTSPLDEHLVPDTINDVIMARIDRLAELPRNALQLASVIGREFTFRLLAQISEPREHTEVDLVQLKAVELIYEASLYPELAYMFKHALTQEVAYNSLLLRRRKALHALIGETIEQLYADRLAEHYDVLAYHYAAGEKWQKASAYFQNAAKGAADAFAIEEAVEHYGGALDALSKLGADADLSAVVALHNARMELLILLSDFDSVKSEAERALWLAKGNPMKAIEHADQCLAIATQTSSQKYVVKALRAKGWAEMARKRLDEAAVHLDGALQRAKTLGNPTQLWRTHAALGELLARTGQRKHAAAAYAQARLVVERTLDGIQDPGLKASLSAFAPVRGLYEFDPDSESG